MRTIVVQRQWCLSTHDLLPGYPSTVEPGWMDLFVSLQLVVDEAGETPRGVANGETPDRRVIRRGSSAVKKI